MIRPAKTRHDMPQVLAVNIFQPASYMPCITLVQPMFFCLSQPNHESYDPLAVQKQLQSALHTAVLPNMGGALKSSEMQNFLLTMSKPAALNRETFLRHSFCNETQPDPASASKQPAKPWLISKHSKTMLYTNLNCLNCMVAFTYS